MRKNAWILVVLLLFQLAPASAATTPPPPTLGEGGYPKVVDYFVHVVIACDFQPDQVEIRIMPDMPGQFKVDGEVKGKDRSGQEETIGGMPNEESKITNRGKYNGPEGRISEKFPDGFDGIITGWAKLFTLTDQLIGDVYLTPQHMVCGHGETDHRIDYFIHVVMSCDDQPDQVEIRMLHDMPHLTTVKVDGKLLTGDVVITEMPSEESQKTERGWWNGPEKRIHEVFPLGFNNVVTGWAQMETLNKEVIGRIDTVPVRMICAARVPVQSYYIPYIQR